MAVSSIFAFFVVTYLVILHCTGEKNGHPHRCPESVDCGTHGQIKFPLYSTKYQGCGFFEVNCSEGVAKFRSGGRQWFQVDGSLDNISAIRIDDRELKNRIDHKNCDLFINLFHPATPSSPIRISPNLTLFKCTDTSSPASNQPTESHFRGFHNYKGCPGFTIYYKYRHYHGPTPGHGNLPHDCLVIQLPAVPPIGNHKSGDLFSLLAAKFSVGLHVPTECYECHLKGDRCRLDTENFQCAVEKEGRRNNSSLIIVTVIPGGVLLLLCLLILTIRCRNIWSYVSSYIFSRNTSSDPSSKADLEGGSIFFGVPVFSYTELEAATNNFDPSKELGDGGFGTVYHGKLQDGREVAVKRLYEHNYKRVTQFINEIEILTRLRHCNLVSLYGCTSRLSQELLLVYEYIPNGTVADHLHGHRAKDGSLTWPIRMNIAIETAKALAYLHASDIIHRDVKTNNILLDNSFCVKVADFGLSRLFPTNVTHVSTAPQGTPGYVDPEYRQCYQLTDKSDVYSFGVVLIELISSMQAVDFSRHRHEINLANLAMNRIQNRAFNDLIDPSLGFESDSSIERMTTSVAEVAFRCLQLEKEMRPTMDEVLESLTEIQEYKDENTGEIVDNVEVLTSKLPPPSLEGDDAVLLKNGKVPLSPDSVTQRWVSCPSPSISSG